MQTSKKNVVSRIAALPFFALIGLLPAEKAKAALTEGPLYSKDFWIYEFPTNKIYDSDTVVVSMSDLAPKCAEYKDASGGIHRFVFYSKNVNSLDPWFTPGLYAHHVKPDNNTETSTIFDMCSIAQDLSATPPVTCSGPKNADQVAQFDCFNTADGSLYVAASTSSYDFDLYTTLRVYKYIESTNTFSLRTNIIDNRTAPIYPPASCPGSGVNAFRLYTRYRICSNISIGSSAYSIFLDCEKRSGTSCTASRDIVRIDQDGTIHAAVHTTSISSFEFTGLGAVAQALAGDNREWSAFDDPVVGKPRIVFNQGGSVKAAYKSGSSYSISNLYSPSPSNEVVPILAAGIIVGATPMSQAIFGSNQGSGTYRAYNFVGSTLNSFTIGPLGYGDANSVVSLSDFFFLPGGRPVLIAKTGMTELALTPESFISNAGVYGSDKGAISTSIASSNYDFAKFSGILNGGLDLDLQFEQTLFPPTKTTAVYNPVTKSAEMCTLTMNSSGSTLYAFVQRIHGTTSFVTKTEPVANPTLALSGEYPSFCLAYATVPMPNNSAATDPENIYKLSVNTSNPVTHPDATFRIRLNDESGPSSAAPSSPDYSSGRMAQMVSISDFTSLFPSGGTFSMYVVGKPTISSLTAWADLYQVPIPPAGSGSPVPTNSIKINSFAFARVAALNTVSNVGSWDFSNIAQRTWTVLSPPAFYGIRDFCNAATNSGAGAIASYSGGVLTLGSDQDGFVPASSPAIGPIGKGLYRLSVQCRLSTGGSENNGEVPTIRARLAPAFDPSGYWKYTSSDEYPDFSALGATGGDYVWKDFYFTVLNWPIAGIPAPVSHVAAIDVINSQQDGSPGIKTLDWTLEIKKIRLDLLYATP